MAHCLLDGMEQDLASDSAQDEDLNRPRRLTWLLDEQGSRHGISDLEDDAVPVVCEVWMR